MPNLIADGMHQLTGLMQEHASEEVTYRRGEDMTDLIIAVPGRSDVDVTQGDTVTRVTTHDWIFRPSDLVLSDGPVEPQEGDLIIHRDREGYECVYAVLGINGLAPAVYDAHRSSVRVHTKLRDRSLA